MVPRTAPNTAVVTASMVIISDKLLSAEPDRSEETDLAGARIPTGHGC